MKRVPGINSRFEHMSESFRDQLKERIDHQVGDDDLVTIGLAQRDAEIPYVMAVAMDEICTGGNFDMEIWEAMIDDAFENDILRPWFFAVAVPVSSDVDGQRLFHVPFMTMERMLCRYSYFEQEKTETGFAVVGEAKSLQNPYFIAVLDMFAPALRKHVVHQG